MSKKTIRVEADEAVRLYTYIKEKAHDSLSALQVGRAMLQRGRVL